MRVRQFVNRKYGSNSYLITDDKEGTHWLVDAGNTEDAIRFLNLGDVIDALFLTHSHFDHILQINTLISRFPECIIYISAEGKEGLYSEKNNLSFYQEQPMILHNGNVTILDNSHKISFNESLDIETFVTKGHHPGCLTYRLGSYLFTGDSYIPGIKVVTKLKGGNREEALQSLQLIRSLINPDTIVCPGHGHMVSSDSLSTFLVLESIEQK